MTLDRPRATLELTRSSSPADGLVVPLSVVALVVGAVPFGMHAWAALHGYFWQDDFVITYRAARGGPVDFGYLFQAYNREHVAPGMFLVAWVITAIAPLGWAVAMGPLLVVQAVTLVLLWRVLVRCFGARPGILPAFAVFAWSPLILLPTLWWAYAIQLFPLLLAMVGALGAHVRYLETGRPRHAVGALVWTVAGMAFYEKAVLIPIVLFGVTLLLAPAGEPSVLGWTLRRHGRLWLWHGALIAGYAALYLTITLGRASGPEPRHASFGELARRMVADTFLPGMFGGPLAGSDGGTSWAGPPLVVRVVAVLAAAGLIIGGLVAGGRRARTAWLFLAGYLLVDFALIAVARLPIIGTAAGADPRYLADAVPVAVLCAAFAFLAPGTESRPARPTTRLAVIGLTTVVAVAATVSFLELAPGLRFTPARDYVATARAALAADPSMVLYDGDVPNQVMISWFAFDAKPSRVIGLLPGPPRFDQPTEKLYLLDDTGRPQPVDQLTNPVTSPPGPVPSCGYPVAQAVTVIPLTRATIGRVLRIEYYTADTGDGTVNVAGHKTTVRFERGAHFLYLVVNGPYIRVDINRDSPLAAACIVSIQAGEPR